MSTFAYSIPSYTENGFAPNPIMGSVAFGITNITVDPDGILTAGANTDNDFGAAPPNALGFITNSTLNNKTINYTISLNLTITPGQPGLGLELYVGPAINPSPINSQQILFETGTGVFNYTFSGSINVAPNSSICFWGTSGLTNYTIDADVSGEMVGQQTTVGGGTTGVQFFCDISPDCPPAVSFSENRIICDEIEFVECNAGDCPTLTANNGLLICSELESWNCNLCGNDLPYNSPVEVGDSLYFQFQQQDGLNGNSPTLDGGGLWGNGYGWSDVGLVQGYIRDCCTGEYLNDNTGNPAVITSYSTNYFVGIFESTNFSGSSNNYTNIQQIKIETTQLYADLLAQFGRNCFYLEFIFYPDDPNLRYSIFSEPFEFVPCDNQTVLLEGSLTRKDCNNLFYGDPGCVIVNNPINVGGGIVLNNYQPDCRYFIGTGVFPFRQYYRVYGSFEQTAFEIVKELVGTRLKSTSIDLTESWLLRTDRVPQRVAKLIATILSSEYVYINKKEYVVDGQIPKNNEIGSQWFIEANVKRVNCTNNYSCN